jgi:protein subunit release factor B
MSERKLILSVTKKDFDITFFSGSGAGGQHRNKKKCSVRMKHRDSGAMSTGQDSRDKQTNIRNAFLRCITTDKYKTWERKTVAERMLNLSSIEKEVDKQMEDSNLKVEIKDENGCWTEISEQEWKVLEELEEEHA